MLDQAMSDTAAQQPMNIIYTGVAGTGKTYRLLQIAKHYTDYLPKATEEDLLGQLLDTLSWREVICLVLLDFRSKQQDLVKVPEIVSHGFFVAKAAQNDRESNLNSTAWLELRRHSPIDSKTVRFDNRASQAYFDKDHSGAWYLLADSMALLTELSQQLTDYQQALHNQFDPSGPQNPADRHQHVSQRRFTMVSFHQAYGYEEFVEGIRPVLSTSAHSATSQAINTQSHGRSSQMRYQIADGAFLKLCHRAASDPEQRYAILIDEINRANVSRVFGELLSLIEPDKRAGMANAMTVDLAYSGHAFSVPANVDIYATMNTQDHSLAPLDMALRRRFRFIDCPPQPELLSTICVDTNADATSPAATIDLAKLLTGINNRIAQTLGAEAQLGHAFLLPVHSLADLQMVLVEQIIPQLAQAAGGQVAVLQYIFDDEQQPMRSQFIHDRQMLIDHQMSGHQLNGQPSSQFNNPQYNNDQHQLFAGQGALFGQSVGAAGYRINADLIAKAGAFSDAAVYQRLYPAGSEL